MRPLFGDPDRSPLWAVVLEGEGTTQSVPLSSNMVSVVVVTEGDVSWNGNEGSYGSISELSVTAIVTGSEGVALSLQGRSEASVITFSQDLFEGLVKPFRTDLLPELNAVLKEGKNAGVATCMLPAPFVVHSRIVPELQEVHSIGASGSFWFEGQIRLLLSQVCFRQVPGSDVGGGINQFGKSLKRVNQARRILNDRPEDSLDLSTLAEKVGCSASYLSRTFAQMTGMTISQYLRRCRINMAARLLAGKNRSVSAVAAGVGYGSLSHFSKAFQAEKGCLPSHCMTSSCCDRP